MEATSLQGSPLSVQQNHLWPWQRNDQVYRTMCAIQVQGMWDRERFKQALAHVIARHEILRTAFYALPGMDVPMQVISQDALWSYTEISLEQLAASEQTRRVDELFVALKREAHNLQDGPLLLVQLVYLHANQQIVLVSLPAICADGYSLKLFINELLNTYIDRAPVEEVLQYADVSAWQEEQLSEDEALPQREYWRKIMQSQKVGMKVPFHTSEVVRVSETFAPQVAEIAIPDGVARNIEMQAREYDVSVSSWLLACWKVLLWRLGNETALMVGVACDGRDYEELTNALGPYSRFVPVEARFEKDRSFALMLAAINISLQEAVKRQLYFTWDTAYDQAKDDATHHYFPVSFEYEEWPATIEGGALTCSLLKRWNCVEPFDLKLSVVQRGEQLSLELHYNSQRVTQTQGNWLAGLFVIVLEQVTQDPQTQIGALSLLSAQERKQLVLSSRGPRREWSEQSVQQLFEAQVTQHPNAPAVISRQEQWSYQQLNARANQLAQVLRTRGVGAGTVVGLCLEREAAMLVGLLGILKAGGAYLPLDADSPEARLRYQLEESGARWLVTQAGLQEKLPAWAGQTLVLEEVAQEMAEADAQDQVREQDQADALAWVIYTSGSTGKPKGVMVRQSSVVNYTRGMCEQLGAEVGWQYATVSTLAADLGNTAIFCALASGGCVHVLDYETATSGEAMATWAAQHPIDVLKIVPSHLGALLESQRAQEMLPQRALVLGGEALPEGLLQRIAALGARCAVYNHYGPTETTVGVLVNALGVQGAEEPSTLGGTVALGRPLANTQVYVLDERMQVVPAGVRGELYIGGAGVGWGYVGQGGQTGERFVPDPYSEQEGGRLYRTGDWGRRWEDGKIAFEGRADGQVKLRGYRIELGEIEAVLRQHPQVRECVVLLRNDEGGEPRLVGYVVSRQRARITREQLEAYVCERLPEYMVPLEYVLLEEWPLTANGKVDRQRLPKPEKRITRTREEAAQARSPLEELILRIWRELLGGAEIGVHDNFFIVGGNSLLAMRMIAQIQDMLRVELSVRAIFEAPTVAGLGQRIEQALRKGEAVQIPPLVAGVRPEGLPLSYAQQRLWFLEQLEPESIAYLAARALWMRGVLDARSLERSLEELIRRHESLRTIFVVGATLHDAHVGATFYDARHDAHVGAAFYDARHDARQVIQPVSSYSLPVIDLQGLLQEQKEEEARQLVSQEAQRPCDLTKGPLLRTYLLRLEPHEHVALLTLHHIITDGWSNSVFVRELGILYQAFVDSQPSPLTPLAVQYADYAVWQREWLQGEILEAQLAYWRKQLANISPLELPTDYSRLPGHTYRGGLLSMELSEALSERLVALSHQENVTMFMLLLAAFQVLLMRYTRKTDISVSTPIANRTRTEIEDVIGFFVNMLVMRTDFSADPTFRQVLDQVREVCTEAYVHQDVSFEKLVEMLQPERDLNRSSLFQVSFQVANMLALSQLIPGLSLEAFGDDGASADYDLRVMMTEGPHGISCMVFYDTNLFEEQTIHRFLEHFQILLQGIVSTPEKAVALLPLLSEQERHMQLVEWTTMPSIDAHDQCIQHLFEQQAWRAPEAVALVYENETLTYGMLNRRANQLAHHLQTLGVGPEVPVGVCMERSIPFIIALLGILKAGGAYIPLDPSYPKERLAFMLADAQVRVLITRNLFLDDLSVPQLQVVNLDVDQRKLAQEQETNPAMQTTAENLAYVMYTSGSTGGPKGIGVPHSAINRLVCGSNYVQIQPTDRIAQASNVSFDAATFEIWGALLNGAQIVGLSKEVMLSSEELAQHIVMHHINILFVTTALFNQIVREAPQALASIHTLLFGGEAVDPRWVRIALGRYAPQRLLHVYGPTETTTFASWYLIQHVAEDAITVPIGYPLTSTQLYVLDENLQTVPVGVYGELYIGGGKLARGYLNHPELTAERFIPHPFVGTGFAPVQPGARLYKTGDLVRYRVNGEIEYVSRLDHQVKLRGYRIELSEIEVALREHPAVQNAVVIMREDRLDDTRLAAYIVLDQLLTESTSQEVQVPLIAERLKHWQGLYDVLYQQGTSQTIQTFNTVGWNSSYTGQPIPAEEMHSWLEDTLALVRTYQPERLWEIGCGTGLLLFPLAPACMRYYGTDFSATVLEEVSQQLTYLKEERGIAPAVTLLQREADDFSAFPEDQIDTVLINSVTQYFPNVDYLCRVLDGAVRHVVPGGRIILGDVRSFSLLEAFHADVQQFRAPETVTRQQLWQRVQQNLQQERELVIDPTFFRRWAQATGRVSRVEVRLKKGRHHNELTQFRYQVVLHIGEPAGAKQADKPHIEKLNWSEQELTREQVRQKLTSEQPCYLRLRHVPNARVEQAVQTLQWLKGEDGPDTVGQWRTALPAQTWHGVEPEDIWADAEQLGYHATINWGQHTADGHYSVLLQRKDVEPWDDAEEELLQEAWQDEIVYNWQRYANQPLQGDAERLLVPQIRQYLRERLPEYMVPASLVVLETLPLTPNGKVDRKALPVPEEDQGQEHEEQDGPGTPIEELVEELWSDVLGRTHVGIHENFFELGGHSLLIAQVVARMRELLRVELPVRAVFEAPTVAAIAQKIEQIMRKGEGVEMPPLVATAYPEAIPLSFAQQRLWFLDQRYPGSITYLGSALLRLRGLLNARALERSLHEIVTRHESLRTTFAAQAGQPRQVIHPIGDSVLPIIDLENLRQEQRAQEAQTLARQETQQPLDLVAGPLLRTYLFRLGVQEHLMLLTMHHIITDGWSYDVLARELTTLYRAYVAEQPSPLAPLPIQYPDYAIWQRQWLQGEVLQKHITYWQQQLKGATSLELPTDASRLSIHSDQGARYAFTLSKELSAALVALSRQEGVTLFMSLLAAFQILLYRLSGKLDIVVGTDVANRTHVETEALIGFFVNLLALRTDLQGAPGFRKVVQQVRTMVLEAYTYQGLPFELVVEHVQVERKEHQTPLVQVLFVLQNAPNSGFDLPDLTFEMLERQEASARFDLALFMREGVDGIEGSVVYRADLFQEQTIASWMRQFEVLLNSIVLNPDAIIDVLEIHTDEEKARRTQEKLAKSHVEARRIRATKSKGLEIG